MMEAFEKWQKRQCDAKPGEEDVLCPIADSDGCCICSMCALLRGQGFRAALEWAKAQSRDLRSLGAGRVISTSVIEKELEDK